MEEFLRLPILVISGFMPTRFDFIPTRLKGLTIVGRKPVEDGRGLFERLFCARELEEIGLQRPIVQVNHSITRKKGTVRGMHFQYPPHAETKIVTCMKGEVFDVAVDIRADSPTFLQWHAEILSAENRKSLFIPEGFAHGFQTLTEDCQLLYFHTKSYASDAEGGLNAQDPLLGISWPRSIAEISDRDRGHPYLSKDFSGITL